MVYPFTFEPIFKERVWGGRTLEKLYAKPLPAGASIGESWELSDRPEGASVIANGPWAGKDLRWLMENHAEEILGKATASEGRFPLLVKILDARERLSLQVHPPSVLAPRLRGEPKTEMWYVTDAEEGAEIMAGLRKGVLRAHFSRLVTSGSAANGVQRLPVKAGDAMFLPSGRVHALGKGIVLFEIQQNSDTTYRVFDWNRVGADGKPRKLHIQQALDSIDFGDFEPSLIRAAVESRGNASVRALVDDPLFSVREWSAPEGYRETLAVDRTPSIIAVVSGGLKVEHPASSVSVQLGPGQFCLVPAALTDVSLRVDQAGKWLITELGAADSGAPTPHRRVRSAAPAPAPAAAARTHATPPAAGSVRTPATAAAASRSADGQPAAAPTPRATPTLAPRLGLEKYSWRRKLGDKLQDYPLLRLLLFEGWFRVAFVAFVLVAVAGGIALPKMWRTTPEGFTPEARISVLDMGQGMMLARGGEKAAAAGDYEAALTSWHGAVANDPGKPEYYRGMLAAAAKQDYMRRQTMITTLIRGLALLRLSHTNENDLESMLQFLDQQRKYGYVQALAAANQDKLTDQARSVYLKSLALAGRFSEFGRLWDELPERLRAAPDLKLFHTAFIAVTGASTEAHEAKERLQAALGEESEDHIAANRLNLAVCAGTSNLDGYAASLNRLENWRADSALDHVTYWSLLKAIGESARAKELARNYVRPPEDEREFVALARVLAELGLTDQAIRLMRRYLNDFAYSEEAWGVYGEVLRRGEEWAELRQLALRIRQIASIEGSIGGVSHYFLGEAELATGTPASAKKEFGLAAQGPFLTTMQGLSIARRIAGHGFPREAKQLIEGLLGRAEEVSRLALSQVAIDLAIELKDEALLREGTKIAFEVQPNDPLSASRYAASLLIDRSRPEESIGITTRLANALPNSIPVLVNHALALLQNQRADDAKAVLDSIMGQRMDAVEGNSFRLARFEQYVQKQQYAQAEEIAGRIDTAHLFPSEVNWLKETRQQLPRSAP